MTPIASRCCCAQVSVIRSHHLTTLEPVDLWSLRLELAMIMLRPGFADVGQRLRSRRHGSRSEYGLASRRARRVNSKAGGHRPGLRRKGSIRIYLPHQHIRLSALLVALTEQPVSHVYSNFIIQETPISSTNKTRHRILTHVQLISLVPKQPQ